MSKKKTIADRTNEKAAKAAKEIKEKAAETNTKKRSDNSERDMRMMAVVELMLEGQRHADIVRSVCSQWNIVERTGYRYIKMARNFIREISKEETLERKGFHIGARMRLLRKHKEDKWYVKEMLDSLAKIEGLFIRNVNIDHTTKGDKIPGATTVYKLPDGTELNI